MALLTLLTGSVSSDLCTTDRAVPGVSSVWRPDCELDSVPLSVGDGEGRQAAVCGQDSQSAGQER